MLDVFQEVAEPSRRRILEELLKGPRSVGQIVESTGLKQPNVSNHLAKLKISGIVRSSRLGRSIEYRIATPAIHSAINLILRPSKGKAKSVVIDEALPRTIAKLGIAGEETKIDEIVDSLLRGNAEIPKIYSKVFTPALTLLGVWWQEGAIDEGQEHLATAIIDRQITKVTLDAAPQSIPHRRAVLGCSEGNYHAIGIRMLSDLLRIDGWNTYFLGQNVPNRSFLAAIREHRPSVALVSCGLDEHRSKAIELIEALKVKGSDLVVGVGGYAVQMDPTPYLEAGADYTADSVEEFLDVLLPILRSHADRVKV